MEHTLRASDAGERLRCLTVTRSLFECRVSAHPHRSSVVEEDKKYAQRKATDVTNRNARNFGKAFR